MKIAGNAKRAARVALVLGSILAAAASAQPWRGQGRVKGVVLEGCPYSIPDANRFRWKKYGSIPSYEEACARAREVLGDDPYNSAEDEIFVAYRCKGPTRQPGDDEIFTYKTWWFLCGPEAYGTMTHRHIGKIALPMVIMRGDADPLVESWVPEALGAIARDAGNGKVRVVTIPGAHHDCMENPEAMVDEIVRLVSA